jgi:hypothetical protein
VLDQAGMLVVHVIFSCSFLSVLVPVTTRLARMANSRRI